MGARCYPLVLVAEGKNNRRYLDARDEAAFHRSALRLLRERFEAGYYYPDPNDDARNEPAVDLKPEALKHIPVVSPAARLHERQVSNRNRWQREHARYVSWHKDAVRALAEQNGELAWRCLEQRDAYEYEGVQLECLEGS